jgi:hypothetical protein
MRLKSFNLLKAASMRQRSRSFLETGAGASAVT